MNTAFLLGGDLPVNRLGYGAMRLCGQPGNFGRYPDWEGGKRLLRRAVELGINLIDTAHAYGPSCNEALIGEALAPYPAGVVIATKGGVEKTAPDHIFPDCRPENLRRRCEESLRLLRVERIDLYQLHRPDPKVPFAESVGALSELRREGKVRHVGLSNVTLAQIEEARGIVPIASVQNRYNLVERDDDPVLDYCAAIGIAYLPWGPLAAKPFARDAPLARTPGALAWLLRRSPNIIAIPGTTSLAHLEANVAATQAPLSDAEFAALSAEGLRYYWAVRLAAGIGLAGLERMSPVGVIAGGERDLRIAPTLSSQTLMQWAEALRQYDFRERTVLSSKIRTLAASLKSRSIIFVLSDLHDPDALPALELLATNHELIVLWLQDPAEARLPRGGIFRAREAETGAKSVLHGRVVLGLVDRIRESLVKSGIEFLHLPIEEPVLPRVRYFLKHRKSLGHA